MDLNARNQLVRLDIDEYHDPTEVARQVRSLWRVPSGPIDHLIRLLESVGVLVHTRPLGTAAQDAVSTWPRGRPAIMLVNSGLPPDRLRFTVAHELGHLVMHSMPSDTQEREANLFAAEFLAPLKRSGPRSKASRRRTSQGCF